jgi:hypothetical protein
VAKFAAPVQVSYRHDSDEQVSLWILLIGAKRTQTPNSRIEHHRQLFGLISPEVHSRENLDKLLIALVQKRG